MTIRSIPPAVLAVLAAVAAGCAPRAEEPAGVELGENEVAVSLVPLFRGDTERIAPHLGLDDWAAMKVDFRGEKLPLHFNMIVRHHGKVVRTQNLMIEKLEKPAEITYSLREFYHPPRDAFPRNDPPLADGEVAYQARVVVAGQEGSAWFRRPVMVVDPTVVSHRKAQKPARMKRGDEFDVCGIYAGKGWEKNIDGESLEARAERSEWSMVLRLVLREWKRDE